MAVKLLYLLCVILCAFSCHRIGARTLTTEPTNVGKPFTDHPTPTQTYDHKEKVDSDGKYWLYWNTNSTHITMEVNVQTRGYVGLGLSSSGNMYPADVVLGWVKDGNAYLKDCHTVGFVPPVEDASQDWILLHGEENDFGTTLKFVRKIDTCDNDDEKIIDSAMHVIYSYHPDDPVSMTSLPWHGSKRRGAKTLIFLSASLQPDAIGMPDDLVTYDFLNKRYLIPPKTTTYRCTCFQFPDLGKKHHVIKIEPNIQPENVGLVHHMVLYHCDGVDPSMDGYTYMCYENAPPELYLCRSAFTAWEVGGRPFYLPPEVGMSLGTPRDPRFFVLETHYNNPARLEGVVDSSGFTISYTPTLRPIDGGVLEGGFFVDPSLIIPPYEENFLSSGYCSAEDLMRGLPREGINVYAVLQHSHLLAKRMTTRLIRNGTELEPLANDKHYDFNFQQTRYLAKERKILPGDRFVLECLYNSTDRTNITLGGLATEEEMCLTFLYYYPKMDLDVCWSQPRYQNIHNDTHIAQEIIRSWDWSDPKVREKFHEVMNETMYTHSSFGAFLKGGWQFHDKYEELVEHPYVDPADSACAKT